MSATATAQYDAFMLMAAQSLQPNEFWCVMHPDGPLEGTASKDMGACVRICCDALNADWDDLKEQGFSLGTILRQCADVVEGR